MFNPITAIANLIATPAPAPVEAPKPRRNFPEAGHIVFLTKERHIAEVILVERNRFDGTWMIYVSWIGAFEGIVTWHKPSELRRVA